VDVVLVGPGRAGRSLARRFTGAGHGVVGVLARRRDAAAGAARDLSAVALDWDTPLPRCDLILIAVSDRAIAEVAERLAPVAGGAGGAVHLSGLVPSTALAPLAGHMPVGSFHPLQTLPNPEVGAARLGGAWVAVTSDDGIFADRLFSIARALGMHPFELDNEWKALYHAGASAAANYCVAVLALAERLMSAAGVPFEAVEPLVRAVVDNTFALGPAQALTGPIARGDVETVRAQVEAVAGCDPALAADFRAMGRATARLAGTAEGFDEVLG
jgi:predicted short-subunit dehydrogenase-like oxidoreductase (DUF2520 family)